MEDGDSGAVRSKLGIGDNGLWCSSGDDEGTKRGGTGGSSRVRWRATVVARV
jgi:hypothetical protein